RKARYIVIIPAARAAGLRGEERAVFVELRQLALLVFVRIIVHIGNPTTTAGIRVVRLLQFFHLFDESAAYMLGRSRGFTADARTSLVELIRFTTLIIAVIVFRRRQMRVFIRKHYVNCRSLVLFVRWTTGQHGEQLR
ncbi:MAG TPA: hypothetical protein VMV68_08820, partial [Spirochaetia bacterium]|nr:hypothetical protein [Spirochaetia bacterium]